MKILILLSSMLIHSITLCHAADGFPSDTLLADIPEQSVLFITTGQIMIKPGHQIAHFADYELPNLYDDSIQDRMHCMFQSVKRSEKHQFLKSNSRLTVEKNLKNPQTNTSILILSEENAAGKKRIVGSIRCENKKRVKETFERYISMGSTAPTVSDLRTTLLRKGVSIILLYP